MYRISFKEHGIKPRLLKRKSLKLFLMQMFGQEKRHLEKINIIFCTNAYLLSLNRKFLNHNFHTDTLTFINSTHRKKLSAEIYISPTVVKKNAKNFNISYQEEIVRVIIHSCLHVCGYNDHPEKENIRMIKRQEIYLKNWIVSRET